MHYDRRLALMKVSRNFRVVTQSCKVVMKRLSVQQDGYEEYSELVFDTRHQINYWPENGECMVEYVNRFDESHQKPPKFLAGEDYMELHRRDLELIMKNRRVQLKTFHFTIAGVKEGLHEKCIEDLENILKSAKSLTANAVETMLLSYSEFASLLSIFPAEHLQKINYDGDTGPDEFGYKHLVTMDQWKMAREFNHSIGELDIPFENFLNFDSFCVQISRFTRNDAVKLRNMIERSPNFKSAQIFAKDMDAIRENSIFLPDDSDSDSDDDPVFGVYNIRYTTSDERLFYIRFYRSSLYIKKSDWNPKYDFTDF